MTQENPDKAKGCFTRLALFFGLFWLVAVGVVLFTQTTGSSLEFTGSLLPIIFFFGILGVIRRRASQSTQRNAKSSPEPIPQVPPPTPPVIPGRTIPVASPPATPPPVVSPPRREPPRPAPTSPAADLPPEEPPAPPDIAALKAIDMGDLEPGKPLTSEERIKLAHEKYLKKP